MLPKKIQCWWVYLSKPNYALPLFHLHIPKPCFRLPETGASCVFAKKKRSQRIWLATIPLNRLFSSPKSKWKAVIYLPSQTIPIASGKLKMTPSQTGFECESLRSGRLDGRDVLQFILQRGGRRHAATPRRRRVLASATLSILKVAF